MRKMKGGDEEDDVDYVGDARHYADMIMNTRYIDNSRFV